jgi:hypothetical protein
MATYTKQWKLTNVNDSLTFGSVEEFFNKSCSTNISEEQISQHIDNEAEYVLDKFAVLSTDKKSIVIQKDFKDEASYNEWKEKADALPDVDDLIKSEEGHFIDEEKKSAKEPLLPDEE